MDATEPSDTDIQFTPARVLMQDLTGVPCVVDLVAMREAMTALGGDPGRINPLVPTELVIVLIWTSAVKSAATAAGLNRRSPWQSQRT